MILHQLPKPIDILVDMLASFLDHRHAELFEPVFTGTLFGRGRRTATSWFRAGGIDEQFRRGYTMIGSIGRKHIRNCAQVVFRLLREYIEPGSHWLFAIDDTPTKRYGPEVEGAGIHHNPTPGPAQNQYVYGHIWVTSAWVVRHPDWNTLALPLIADMYVREVDLPDIPRDRRPDFETKLEQASGQIRWLAHELQGSDKPIWTAVDGAYSKRPVLQTAKQEGVVVVGKLPHNAALYDVPKPTPAGERGPGRPRIYGAQRLSLAKRAAHRKGWVEVECFQYQKTVKKTVKTFLATWRPAGGVIRVVLVKESSTWLPYFCTNPEASVVDILEAASGRTSVEDVFKDVKEVEGAGKQQLRNVHANAGAYHLCLWSYSAVELWGWDKSFEELCDRSDSPWDEDYRRPSHANRRKALQLECLREEFLEELGDRPSRRKIQEVVEEVLGMVA